MSDESRLPEIIEAIADGFAALGKAMVKFLDGPHMPECPEWSHPCPVCSARGYTAPHPGQHPVITAPLSRRQAPGPPPPGR